MIFIYEHDHLLISRLECLGCLHFPCFDFKVLPFLHTNFPFRHVLVLEVDGVILAQMPQTKEVKY